MDDAFLADRWGTVGWTVYLAALLLGCQVAGAWLPKTRAGQGAMASV